MVFSADPAGIPDPVILETIISDRFLIFMRCAIIAPQQQTGHARRCTIFSQIANFCRKVLGKPDEEHTLAGERIILSRDQHPISRRQISDNALKVLYRLNKAGYEAYLVGGGVRDLLLDKSPKDFDIATNATPEQIKKLFSNCRLVGRRFRLAHVVFGRDVIEVATFRGHHHKVNTSKNLSSKSDEGMLLRDNVYGSIEEDAERRDFTVNALYYSIKDFSLHDFHGGLQDLEAGVLELIGDPETRYREDPVRMLRAIRFAAKLDLKLTERTAEPIHRLASLLSDIPAARLFEESLKLFLAGHALQTYKLLREYDLFAPLFPQVVTLLTPAGNSRFERFLEMALINTDERVQADLPVTPTFLYAALLWGLVEKRSQDLAAESSLPPQDILMMAMNEAIDQQIQTIAIPRRFTSDVREIWLLQYRLPRRSGKRAERLFAHPRFRAALDFLELRSRIDGRLKDLTLWWQDYQQQHAGERPQQPVEHLDLESEEESSPRHKKPRRRRRRAPRHPAGQA